jgi:hypothetical protein
MPAPDQARGDGSGIQLIDLAGFRHHRNDEIDIERRPELREALINLDRSP